MHGIQMSSGKKKRKKITDSKQKPKTTKRNNFLDNSRWKSDTLILKNCTIVKAWNHSVNHSTVWQIASGSICKKVPPP